MDIGLHVASFSWPNTPQDTARTLAEVARVADQGGVRSLHVMDHFFQLDQYIPAEEPMLEGYTTLGYLAGMTSQIQVGLLVGGVTYRHPGLLAKTITTLDVLSGGRAILGIGAGWYEREHLGLGVPFPSTAERFERLEETLQICLQMWSGNTGSYEGVHYQLAETLNQPPAVTQPHPPIMIGGGGEKKTLRLVAQYANASNLIEPSPEAVAHKLGVLRQHCDRLGTDYDAIHKTLLYVGQTLARGDTDAFVQEMVDFAKVGVEGVIVMPFGDDPIGFAERAASVVPQLASL